MALKDPSGITRRFNRLTLRENISNNRWAILNWGIREGYPRSTLFVFTKDNDTNKINTEYFIPANMDYDTFLVFCDIARKLINTNTPGSVMSIECKNKEYKNGKAGDEIVTKSHLTVGINDSGMFITILPSDRKMKDKVVFSIKYPIWHTIRDKNGKLIDEKEINMLYAKAYMNDLEKTMEYFYLEHQKMTTKLVNNNFNNLSSNANKNNDSMDDELAEFFT